MSEEPSIDLSEEFEFGDGGCIEEVRVDATAVFLDVVDAASEELISDISLRLRFTVAGPCFVSSFMIARIVHDEDHLTTRIHRGEGRKETILHPRREFLRCDCVVIIAVILSILQHLVEY